MKALTGPENGDRGNLMAGHCGLKSRDFPALTSWLLKLLESLIGYLSDTYTLKLFTFSKTKTRKT